MEHHDRKHQDELFLAILDTFLFPIFRISKILFSGKPFREAFMKSKGQVIYDLFATIFLGVVFYYLGRITLFGHQFYIFWEIGGVFAFILLVSYLIGYLRKRHKVNKLNNLPEKDVENEPATSKAVLLTPEQLSDIIRDNPNILKNNPQLKSLM